MKSDIIKISRNEDNLNKILYETQKTAEYKNTYKVRIESLKGYKNINLILKV